MAMIDNIFLEAVKKGNKSVVKTFIKKGGINFDKRDQKGLTPLYFSSLQGFRDIVLLLLEGGADPTLASNDSLEPIHAAAEKGNKEIIKILIDNGAYIDTTDRDGKTALMYAIRAGKQDIAKYLVSLDADYKSLDNNGKSPLSYATASGLRDLVTKLLDEESINETDDYGNTPLHKACSAEQIEIVRALLRNPAININAENDQGATPLIKSIRRGNLAIAELLINAGADVNINYNDSMSALHIAAYAKFHYIGELLIRYGIDINAKAANGATALILAAQKGNNDFVEMLIANGANVWAVDNNDKSALYYASLESYNEIVEQLIMAGAADEPAYVAPVRPQVELKPEQFLGTKEQTQNSNKNENSSKNENNTLSYKKCSSADTKIKILTDGKAGNQFVICEGKKFDIVSNSAKIERWNENGDIEISIPCIEFNPQYENGSSKYHNSSSWGNCGFLTDAKDSSGLNISSNHTVGFKDAYFKFDVSDSADEEYIENYFISTKVNGNILTFSLDTDDGITCQFDLEIPADMLSATAQATTTHTTTQSANNKLYTLCDPNDETIIAKKTNSEPGKNFVIYKGRRYQIISNNSSISRWNDEGQIEIIFPSIEFDEDEDTSRTSNWGNCSFYTDATNASQLNYTVCSPESLTEDACLFDREYEDFLSIEDYVLSTKVNGDVLTVSLDAYVESNKLHCQFDLEIPKELFEDNGNKQNVECDLFKSCDPNNTTITRKTSSEAGKSFVVYKGRRYPILSNNSEIKPWNKEGLLEISFGNISFDAEDEDDSSSASCNWGNCAFRTNVKKASQLNFSICGTDSFADACVYDRDKEEHLSIDDFILTTTVNNNVVTVTLDACVESKTLHCQFDLTIPNELM